jgi:F420-dependent oxidoreductase-like protein
VTPTAARAPVTRVGLQLSGYTFPGLTDHELFAHLTEIARVAETAGFDSLWAMDHLQQIASVGDPDEPILEAYTTLAALAAVTSTARIGALVSAGGFRPPALLAKMVTTIDVISRGRAVLGLGAGWLEEEHAAYGLPFPPLRERHERLAETVAICRAMFTMDRPAFHGRHHRIDHPYNVPAPLTAGGPPILIGGGGERRLIPMVARLGDAANFYGGPATFQHKAEVLERACADAGRDPAAITKTWLGAAILVDSERERWSALEHVAGLLDVAPAAVESFNLCGTEDQLRDQARAYRAAGADGLIVTLYDVHDLERVSRMGRVLREAMDDR